MSSPFIAPEFKKNTTFLVAYGMYFAIALFSIAALLGIGYLWVVYVSPLSVSDSVYFSDSKKEEEQIVELSEEERIAIVQALANTSSTTPTEAEKSGMLKTLASKEEIQLSDAEQSAIVEQLGSGKNN